MARAVVTTRTIANVGDVGVWFFEGLVSAPGLISIGFQPSVNLPDTVGSYGWAGFYYVVDSDIYLGQTVRILSFGNYPTYLQETKNLSSSSGRIIFRGIYFRTEFYGYPGTFTVYEDPDLSLI